MKPVERAAAVTAALEELYPAAECALRCDGEPWKLLVMGRLSAQCTDVRVNEVAAVLFERFPTARDLADGDIAQIEEIVRPCGLYHVKAADIKAECAMLCDKYGGVLPRDMDALLALPGVGRKIANLLLGDVYGMPAVVADTHCIRVAARIGLTSPGEKDPVRTEKTLVSLLDPAKSADFCHRIVNFGRDFCSARAPRCPDCPLATLCERNI